MVCFLISTLLLASISGSIIGAVTAKKQREECGGSEWLSTRPIDTDIILSDFSDKLVAVNDFTNIELNEHTFFTEDIR